MSGGTDLAEEFLYKPKQALKAAMAMEARGEDPGDLLDKIPTGKTGLEWVTHNIPLAKQLSPKIIIGGVGDGLLEHHGIKYLLEEIGVKFCRRQNDNGDNFYTSLENSEDLKDVLKASGGVISMKGYSNNPDAFIELVKAEIRGTYKTRRCIGHVRAKTVWGFKNPRQMLALPVIGAAFGLAPKIVIIARDPRDTCTSKNKNLIEEYCPLILRKEECARTDCYSFWAHVYYQLIERYNKKENVCFIRIEDLIQDPTSRGAPGPGIVKRLSDALGVQPTFEDALNTLKEMHKFNNSLTLGLGGSAMTAKTRKKLLKETELHGDPRLREVMNNLGYHPTSYDLLTPKTKMMC